MPRKVEEETRCEDEEKAKKKARYESWLSRSEDGEIVPKDLLSSSLSQVTWNLSGKKSRIRVLNEKPTPSLGRLLRTSYVHMSGPPALTRRFFRLS